jgi:hypothetical protein
MYGVDERGKLFVHIRIYKQRRIYGEVLVTEGKVQLFCRECLRWHTVVIRQPGSAALVEDETPAPLTVDPTDTPMLAPPTPTT